MRITILATLEDFINHRITAETFVNKFLALMRQLRHDQEVLLERQDLSRALKKIRDELIDGNISKAEYAELTNSVYAMITDCEICPGSRESEILFGLFTDASMYTEFDVEPPFIDENELRQCVEDGFAELKEIISG